MTAEEAEKRWIELYYAPFERRIKELRANPYHDSKGRFTFAPNSSKSIDNSSDRDIIKSRVTSGALNPESNEAQEHAERYYQAVRKMKSDYIKIAVNTGYSAQEIKEIKDFIFNTKHDFGNGITEYFSPDYDMAQSWQRLIDGKNIQKHDLTLLKHEMLEQLLMKSGRSQRQAHKSASAVYNYAKEVKEYNDKINRNKANK